MPVPSHALLARSNLGDWNVTLLTDSEQRYGARRRPGCQVGRRARRAPRSPLAAFVTRDKGWALLLAIDTDCPSIRQEDLRRLALLNTSLFLKPRVFLLGEQLHLPRLPVHQAFAPARVIVDLLVSCLRSVDRYQLSASVEIEDNTTATGLNAQCPRLSGSTRPIVSRSNIGNAECGSIG